jgi:hypothetical protein
MSDGDLVEIAWVDRQLLIDHRSPNPRSRSLDCHDGGRIVFEGTPADRVAARSTLTGEHLAAYVGT